MRRFEVYHRPCDVGRILLGRASPAGSGQCATTRCDRADLQQGRRADPLQTLRQLPSAGRNRADVAADATRQARPYAKAIANAIDEPHHAAMARRRARRAHFTTSELSPIAEARDADGVGRGRCGRKAMTKDLAVAAGVREGWSLGIPDVVLEMQEDYRIPATGTVQYEWFYIPTQLHRSQMGEVDRSQAGQSRRRPPRARLLSREA